MFVDDNIVSSIVEVVDLEHNLHINFNSLIFNGLYSDIQPSADTKATANTAGVTQFKGTCDN